MRNLFTKAKAVLLVCAALFSANLAFAETGTETEADQQNGNKNTTAEGQSYFIDGTYIAGTGSASAPPMTSKGLKFRTGQNGGTLEFTVREGYTVTRLYMAAVGNYDKTDASIDQFINVTKVEADGVEVPFTGGAFPAKGAAEAGELTIENIAATQKIVLTFDNSNAAGTQINASWAIDWQRPDATEPTITVTPNDINLIPGATYQLRAHIDPPSFTTHWESYGADIATVDENGLVTAVSQGMTTIMNVWDEDPNVHGSAYVTVNEFDPENLDLVKSFDFTTMGDMTLTIESEAAGAIWNEANNKPNNVFFCTNEGLQDIAVQAVESGNKGWSIVDGVGLKLASGAGRCAAIGHLTAGQMVEIIYTGNSFYTGSHDDAVRKDDGAEKMAINEGVGRAIYMMLEDGMLGFEIEKGKAVEIINVYDTFTLSHEAYIEFDKSRLENWKFPSYVTPGTEIAIPYYVQTYVADLENVVVSLIVNGEVADRQEIGDVIIDEEMGEGTGLGQFTYTAAEEGELTIKLLLSFDGSDNNEGKNETEEVVITVSSEGPEAPVLENIAALKAYTGDISNVVVTLNDAKVTYAGTVQSLDMTTWEPVEVDVVVFEDASAGIMFQGSGLGNFVSAGQVLNGQLALGNVESVWGDISAKLTESGIEGVTVTDGEVAPLVLSDDNLLEYLAAPDWHLVELADVTFKVVAGEYSENTYLVSDQIGEIGIMDVLGANVEIPEGAMKADTAVGYVYSLYGGMITAFQPVSFTILVTTGGENMKANAAADAPMYNLNGVRVAAPQKGIYIQNGKKVVVK